MKDLTLAYVVSFLPKVVLLLLIFLLPLFFLPQTFDFFEFPKQVLLWTAVLTLVILTLLKFALEGQIRVFKTPLSYPILLFLSVYAISAILAQDRFQAFLGFFGRPNLGFLAVFTGFSIFYFVTFYFEQLKEIFWAIWAILASIFILSILAIFYYFGVFFLPIEITRINSFSPAGGIFPLSQFLAVSVPVTLGLIAYFQSLQNQSYANTLKVIILYLILSLAVLAIILTNTLVGWVGLGIGFIIFFFFLPKENLKKIVFSFFPAILILIFIGLAILSPVFKSRAEFLNVNLIKPQGLNLITSWQVAATAAREFPLFGSGPASFLSDFTRFRPVEINLTDAWNLRFTQSGSLYLDILATTGILGLAAFLFILAKYFQTFVNLGLAARDQQIFPVKLGLSTAILSILVTFLFYSVSTTGLFYFAVLLGLVFSLAKILGSNLVSEIKLEVKTLASFLLILALLAAFGFWLIYRGLSANLNYFKARTAARNGEIGKVEKFLLSAVLANPVEDSYWLDLAKVNSVKTGKILQKQNLTDKDRQEAVSTLDLAIKQARKATQLAAGKVVNWETQGDIYATFANQIAGAADLAISSYTRAILLDPPNPNLWLKAGNLLAQTGNLDSVIETFKQAVRLKPNLIDARIYLGRALELKGEFGQALTQYETALTLTQTLADSEIKNRLTQQINPRLEFVKGKVATPAATPTP